MSTVSVPRNDETPQSNRRGLMEDYHVLTACLREMLERLASGDESVRPSIKRVNAQLDETRRAIEGER